MDPTHDGMIVHGGPPAGDDDEDIVLYGDVKEQSSVCINLDKRRMAISDAETARYLRELLSEEKDPVKRARFAMAVRWDWLLAAGQEIRFDEFAMARVLQSVDSKFADGTTEQLVALRTPFGDVLSRLRATLQSDGLQVFYECHAAYCAHMLSRADNTLISSHHSDRDLPTDGYWTLFHATSGPLFYNKELTRLIWDYAPDLPVKRPHAITALLADNVHYLSQQVLGAPVSSQYDCSVAIEDYMVAAILSCYGPFQFLFNCRLHQVYDYIIGARVHPVNKQWLISISSPHCHDDDDCDSKNKDTRCAFWLCPACLGLTYDIVCQFHLGTPNGTFREFPHQLWCPYVGDMAMPRPITGHGLMSPTFDIPDAQTVQSLIIIMTDIGVAKKFNLVNG